MKRTSKRSAAISLLLGTAAALGAGAAQALPQSPTVAGSNAGPGGASFSSTRTTLTVDQTASRVVIDWSSFNIANGETVAFNQGGADWIAFNRVVADPETGLSPLSTLAGSLTAQGGVWLFSPGGVVIGSSANIDVGSLALVTGPLAGGDLNQLLTADQSGLTTVDIGAPSGVGVEVITVRNGAQINASSGYVVLQAETIQQDGAITAADGVGYAAAQTGRIQFLTNPSGQQLQSAGVTLLVGQDRPSFSHTGSTTAAWVGIDTPGGTMTADYQALVSIGGSIVATGVKPDGSNNGVVLLVGGNLGPDEPGYTGSSMGVDASDATISATNGMYVSSDSARLGATQVGGSLDVETYGDITLTAPVSVGGSALLHSVSGSVNIDADLTAGQSISAFAQTIAIGPDVTLRSDSLGEGAGGVTLSSAGDIDASASSLLIAGSDVEAPSDAVTINAGAGTEGGDASLGGISGTDVYVQTYSGGVSGKGAITFNGNVYGSHSVLAYIDDIGTQNGPTGALSVLGGVSSQGFVDLENLGQGSVVVGPGANVRSFGNQVFLYGGGDTTIASEAQVGGASMLIHTLGLLRVDAGASLFTTGEPAPATGTILPYGAEYQRATGLNLAAGSLLLQGDVTAGAEGARDDILIEVLNTGAPAEIGGDGGGEGFNLSDASFSHLTARNVIIMGGPGEANGPGVDLHVQDLSLDSGRISGLWLGTASSRKIRIDGAVTAVGGAPVNLQIGFGREGLGGSDAGAGGGPIVNPNPDAVDGFIPGEIDVSGGLGTLADPLGQVSLIARNDIFFGSPEFIAAAAADPAFNAVIESSRYPGQDGRVFIAADGLQLSAQARIIQQNTSGPDFTGLSIGAPTAERPLVAIPVGLNGRVIGDDDWTADYAVGPTAIDLFAVVPGAAAGVDTARLTNLVDAGIASAGTYRVNSCVIGDACLPLPVLTTFLPPILIDQLPSPTQPQAQFIPEGSAADGLNADDGAIGDAIDSERLGATNPVTESGNRELWTGKRKRPSK